MSKGAGTLPSTGTGSNSGTYTVPPGFDRDWYLATYPDVAASGVDPVMHYDKFGAFEGRFINAQDQAQRQSMASQYANNPYAFDPEFYLRTNPDVANAIAGTNMDPRQHYQQYGMAEGRSRNAYEAAGGIPHADPTSGVGVAPAPDTSSQRLNPNDPASWAAWSQRASNQTQGLNRLPYVAPSSDTLSADPLAVISQFYPRGNNWGYVAPGMTGPSPQAAPVDPNALPANAQAVTNLGMMLRR
jgi:hypothetical protein